MSEGTSWLEAVGMIAGTVLAGALTVFYKKISKWANSLFGAKATAFDPDTLKWNGQIDMAIRVSLTRLQERTGADRAYVVGLHNGGHDATGFSYTKMSCKYEVVKSGVSSEKESSKDLMLSDYPEVVAKLTGDSDIQRICFEELEHGTPLRQLFIIQGVKGVLGHRVLLSAKGMPVIYGFIGISFCDKECGGIGGLDNCEIVKHTGHLQEAADEITANLKRRK